VRFRRSRKTWTWLLALCAFSIPALPSAVRGADDDEQPPGQLRAVKIGSEATVVFDEVGNAIMYEDTNGQDSGCVGSCWGFEAAGSAHIEISPGSNNVQGIDTSSGRTFQESLSTPSAISPMSSPSLTP
jgi:hypothetical protein